MQSYKDRVAKQIEQYVDVENIHELPDIYHYWSHNYLRPKLEEIFGLTDIGEIYADWFCKAIRDSGLTTIISVGAGDGDVEIDVAEKMLKRGCTKFEIQGLELSPVLIERAREKISKKGLENNVRFIETDLNNWAPSEPIAGAMANHSLHHIVALEPVFDSIASILDPAGYFVTSDMIGRNGHMRWPEALIIVQAVWREIETSKKYNQQLKRLEKHEYINHDCSDEGFEGVRAEDILPLLIERFQFERMCAWGGLTDIFVDRGFGHNFDRDDANDKSLIDDLASANDSLMRLGFIKPTQVIAVMSTGEPSSPKITDNKKPDYFVRDPRTDLLRLSGPALNPRTIGPIRILSDASSIHSDGWLSSGGSICIIADENFKKLILEFADTGHPGKLTVRAGKRQSQTLNFDRASTGQLALNLPVQKGEIVQFQFDRNPVISAPNDDRELACLPYSIEAR